MSSIYTMPPRRTYRRRRNARRPLGPLGRLARRKTFWGKVASVAKTAVEAAGEIKRWLVSPGTVNVAPNKLDDLIGPIYSLDGWMIAPLQEGLAQGTDENQRLGNKIGLKGAYVKGIVINNYTGGPNWARVMIIRTRSNFLLDTAPDSPLPDNSVGIIGFPRYRDVQVLWDKRFMLKPKVPQGQQQEESNMVTFSKFIPLRGDTFFKDNTSLKPDKGTVYVCIFVKNTSCDVEWNAQLTYHDKM